MQNESSDEEMLLKARLKARQAKDETKMDQKDQYKSN